MPFFISSSNWPVYVLYITHMSGNGGIFFVAYLVMVQSMLATYVAIDTMRHPKALETRRLLQMILENAKEDFTRKLKETWVEVLTDQV